MKITVTIPAYNEEKTIGRVIKQIHHVLKKTNYAYEVLVVDDGSKDNTVKIAKSLDCIVHSHPRNLGLAETFRTEMQKCLERKGQIIVHIDADEQYRPDQMLRLIKEVENGADLALGSRFRGKIESMPLVKRLGNRAFSHVISQVVKQKIKDCQTGFRAFTRDVAKLTLTSTHTYTQEQIIRTAKAKLKITEVPIFFARRGAGTKSRLMKGPFEYAVRAWINLLRIYRDYEPLKFFGAVGGTLIGIGAILGIWISINVIFEGTAGGIPRVILSALTILTGIQILLFGFLADMKT